jgi:molybdopterin biosynthesis enzyme MoaB
MSAPLGAGELPTEWWKHGDLKVKFAQENPKMKNTKSYVRYERYKRSLTIAAAVAMGATLEDLKTDHHKGYMEIHGMAVEEPVGGKRAVDAATPEDAKHRSKRPTKDSNDDPPDEASNATKKELRFEEPAAHVQVHDQAALMMQIKAVMEETLAKHMDKYTKEINDTVKECKASVETVRRDLAQERVTREREQQVINERFARIEEQLANRGRSHEGNEDDKLTLVVGGFGTVPKEVALDTVSKALDDIAGFVEAFATSDVPSVVFAKFDTEDALTTFLKQQNECEGFGREGLHAGRSKPPEERRRQRALNKIKRAVCETTNAESKTVRLNRRTMKAFRIEGRVAVEIASVSHDAKIHWAHDVSPAVRARTDELLRE